MMIKSSFYPQRHSLTLSYVVWRIKRKYWSNGLVCGGAKGTKKWSKQSKFWVYISRMCGKKTQAN